MAMTELDEETGRRGRLTSVFVGLAVMVIGLLGISRLWVRAGMPFVWDEQAPCITVTEVLTPSCPLQPGDVLLGDDGTPLRHGEEVEFLLDGKQVGETFSVNALRQGQPFTLQISTWGSWYPRRYAIINGLLGIFLLAVGAWVFWLRPRDKPARIFWGLTLTLVLALMIGSARLPAGPKPWTYLAPVLYYLAYPLFPALFLHFAMSFPKAKSILLSSKWQTFLIYFPAVIFVVVMESLNLRTLFSPTMRYFREYHCAFTWHRAYLVLYFLLAMIALLHSYVTAADRSEANKVRWVLWGIAVGAVPFIFFWTLPKLLNQLPLIPEDFAFLMLLVAPLSFAVAIVKYKLFDIEIVINRSLVYGLLTGFIIGLYLLLVGLFGEFLYGMSPQANSYVAIGCTLIAAMLFNPAKQKIQKIVDTTFFRVQYNYRLAIKAFSSLMVSVQSQTETLETLLVHIDASVPIERMVVLLPRNGAVAVAASRGVKEEEEKVWLAFAEQEDVIRLAKSQAMPLAKAGRDESSVAAYLHLLHNFDQTGMEVLLPVEMSTGQLGFLLLGEKRSGLRYSTEDLELLAMLAAEAFSALERIHFQETTMQEHAEKEKLEASNQLKSEFIALVSHELRTPLTAIRWAVQNLLDGIPETPSPKTQSYLRGILENSTHLTRMIENLLDVSKIESGKLEILPESLRLKEIIARVVQSVMSQVSKKNLQIRIDAPEELSVKADRDALEEILSNLIENAIKFSPAGKTVAITARAKDGAAAIAVRDEGVGIPRERQKTIFEKFEQVTQEKKSREKGLGLGLYIVKKLVEAQGGTIAVESQIDAGSTFTFTVPAG